MTDPEVGQYYVGGDQWVGWCFTVDHVSPGTEDFAGSVQIFVVRQPPCLLEASRASIAYYRELGWLEYVAKVEAACTQPGYITREPEWFRQWLQRGFIRRVEEAEFLEISMGKSVKKKR